MPRSVPTKLAVVYLLLGGLWILLSDYLLLLSGASRQQITSLQTAKGWFFVISSAVLIYCLSRGYLASVVHARAALGHSEARFQSFMSHAPAITFIKDATGRYLFVNQRASVLHSAGINLFAGRTDAEVFPPDEVNAMRAADQSVLASGKPVTITLTCRSGAGAPAFWLVFVFPLLGGDGQRLIGGIAVEITDRIRAQDELRSAKDAAEASSRAKDQFLSVLSHELRTPLTPALLAASALQKDEALPPDVRDDIAMIRHQVELESRLIDDLLDLSRINAGKLQLYPEPTDVHALLRSTTRMFQSEIDEKSLKLLWQLDAPRPVASVDPDRVQQSFWNLIGNAIKFTPSGGTVTIRTRNEFPPAERSGMGVVSSAKPGERGDNGSSPSAGTTDHDAAARPPEQRASSTSASRALDPLLCIDIIDTGIGITPEVLPRLFNAFQQADQTLTRQFGGLGLGLSIAKAIAELHGGSITASSEGRNQGATFTLRLPAIPLASGTPVHGSIPAGAGTPEHNGHRILVVEDEPITQNVLARLLRTLGHSVSTASSVDQAVTTARQHEFDLIISDIGLPDGSGWDLLKQLGDHRPARAIAVSGYGSESDVESSRQAGFDAHLTKPIDFAQLQQALLDAAPRA